MPIKKYMPERRRTARMLCADMVEVRWTTISGKRMESEALLEDISESGACLQMEDKLPLQAHVAISRDEVTLEGTVRYCHYREIGYYIGVQFDVGSKWRREKFEPEHLLDLEKMARAERRKLN